MRDGPGFPDGLPHAARASFRPILGPSDRDSFFAQQRRYRRRVWQLEALCALAVLLMGVPLSVVVSPIVWSAAVIGVDLVNLIAPMPDWGAVSFNMLDRVLGANGAVPLQAMATLTAALILPGVVFIGAAWIGVRALVRRSGVDAVLGALHARPPRPDDFEERQLSNLVEEMALAAGVRPPRVMLLDTDAANAGAVGTSHDEAVVIVSRGLLDVLDRDESQAVIAHVVASVGNGDLRASLMMVGVAQTLGVVTMLLGGPFSRRAREGIGHLLRLALHRRGGADEDAARVRAMLETGQDDLGSDNTAAAGRTRLRDVLTLPFVTAQAAFWLNRKVFLWLLVGPAVAFFWRARRYLADAGAVQFTRDPDALARALARLTAQKEQIAGAGWSGHLFVVGRNAAAEGQRLGAGTAAVNDPIDSILPFDPPLRKRIEHLRAAGATFDLPAPRARRSPLATALLVGIGGPLLVLLAFVLGGAALMLVYVSLAIDMLFLLPIVGLTHFALQSAAASWLGRWRNG